MVAAAPVYPYPHPAFPEALLPDSIKSKLQKDSRPHYPQSVLDKQKPLDSPAYDQVEKLAKGVVSLIFALSLVAARADIIWVGNSPLLNYSAGRKRRKQTVWLRRILLLETLAACHGLASGLLHHWETILYAPTSAAPHSMVYALLGEYDSHRTHFATFQVIAKPGPITRLLLLGAQIAGYFVQGLICLVYMPLCFQLARFTAEAASRVYCDLAQDIAAAQVPDIANASVPAVTRMFYSLPDNTNMRQVCLCIEADDVFHAKWEHAATHHHHNAVAHMYAQ